MEGTSVMDEILKFWKTDLQPHFNAEADFLRKYGPEAGYGKDYIARILDDHSMMERVLWKEGVDSWREFTRLLNAHIRFKEDYFLGRVQRFVETGDWDQPRVADLAGK